MERPKAMFVIKKSSRAGRLDEANEKALTPVCVVHVQKIFALLHAQAVTAAAEKGVLIENTAADGNDAKTAVFHSAGEHMIVARSPDENGKIPRKKAVEGIREYVKVFCGEDVSNGLKDDEFFALPKDGEEDEEETLDESLLSFRVFLSESAGIRVMAEADEDDDDEGGEADPGDEAGENDDEDEMGDEDDQDEAGETEPGAEGGETEPGDAARETEPGEDDDDDEEDEDGEEDGFYVLYGLKIKGLKETTVQDALKQWGSNFLKGFGVKLGSSWGGMGSEVHTVGKLMKGLKDIFGAIDDPNALKERVQTAISKKYPSLGEPTVEFRDKKTLVGDLDVTKREGYDGKVKQKILGADYSMYIKVKESDPRQPLLNRKAIANIVTMQIKGLFKKFKNMIKADDVIYLKGIELTNANPEAIRKLEEKIPTYDEVKKIIQDGDKKTYQAVWVALDKLFAERITKADAYTSSQKCREVVQTWLDFKAKYENKSENLVNDKKFKPADDAEKTTKDERLNAFGDFLENYENAILGEEDELTVDESMFVAYDMLTEMFGNTSWNDKAVSIFEDESQEQPKGQVQSGAPAENEQQSGNSGNGETSSENNGGSAENTSTNANSGDSGDSESDTDGDNEDEKHGDDLYLIPMPGVTYEKSDDDDMTGADSNAD